MPNITPWRPRQYLRRADLSALQTVRRECRPFIDGSRCMKALETVVGASVEVDLLGAHRGPPSAPLQSGIMLELAGPLGERLRVGLEVEADLAIAVTARALKRPPLEVRGDVTSDADRASLAGGMAAVVTAVSRHSPRGPLVARWAGPSQAAPAFDTADTATLRVTVDGEAYAARLLLRSTSTEPTELAWSRTRLKGLGETPLAVPVILCACLASAAQVGSLDVGDAWMLGIRTGERTRGVLLAAPEAESGARADLVETGALVLRPGSAQVGGQDMSEPSESDTVVEAVGDVPVLVRVEVGTARMAAREWAALGPGDVVALARGVGDPVTLRVGGVEVATGELVDIEGEMGVRILHRRGGERAT